MKPESDVKILLQSGANVVDCVQLSKGIQSAKGKSKPDAQYCDFAILPTDDWMHPDSNSISNLVITGKENISYGSWVGLMNIPQEVLDPLRHLSLKYGTTSGVASDPQYRASLIMILKYLRPMYDNLDDLEMHNIAFKPSGLFTSTYDDRRGCYIGLHLDSWEQKSFGETQFARNRICINLGNEARYLLFYSLTIQNMFDALDLSLDDLRKLYPRNNLGQAVGYEFMKTYPTYPVTRLKISPGEAYLAPTENLFHDGSTIDQTSVDITFTIRGYFRKMI